MSINLTFNMIKFIGCNRYYSVTLSRQYTRIKINQVEFYFQRFLDKQLERLRLAPQHDLLPTFQILKSGSGPKKYS